MKIGLTSDWHISQYSSIVRSNGKEYSTRLEHLIDSINWAESLFSTMGCYAHICLGDAFDKAELNAAEISALKKIIWGKMYHYFIVGNHEMASSDLSKNTANLFDLMPNCRVIDRPSMLSISGEYDIFVLPYILNANRKPLEEYFENYPQKPEIILSHNDIKGIQMGSFISQDGFTIDEIQANCKLFINGHIHNCGQVADGIYNIGNLCGQNFSEDAFVYPHVAWIIDTETKEIKTFENPYALRFYKLDFTENNGIDYINDISSKIKPNAVVTVRCKEKDLDYLRARFGKEPNDLMPHNCNIIESRFVVDYSCSEQLEHSETILSVDHLNQFENYVKENIGVSELIMSELQEVLK